MDRVGSPVRLLEEMVDQARDERSMELQVTSFEVFFHDASSRVYRGLFAAFAEWSQWPEPSISESDTA